MSFDVSWRPRAQPLGPCAVAACGPVARARALVERLQRGLAPSLSGVAGTDVVVVLGAAGELPWEDGVVYLGRDPAAPGLLLPTLLEPTVPVDLFARALARLHPLPLAVLPELVVPVAAARPLDAASLAAWLAT